MKVILLHDVPDLGKKFEVKTVAGGYVRNFLLPKKLVRVATPEALRELQRLKANAEKEEAELKKHLTALAQKIRDTALQFSLRVDEKGGVFGSVTKEMILKALREHQLLTKERIDIELDHPLKEFGEHQLNVDLKKGITATLKVILRPQA